jgi:hypothetical protein
MGAWLFKSRISIRIIIAMDKNQKIIFYILLALMVAGAIWVRYTFS